MAVSPMQKITLVTSKALLPELLTVLQEDGQVHLNNLKVLDDWQDLEANERGTSKREDEAEAVQSTSPASETSGKGAKGADPLSTAFA